jgi:hypothetical protein
MKKLFVLIGASLFFYQISNAQTEKGSQTLGINLNGFYQSQNGNVINTYDNSSSSEASTTKSFGIGPAYGYFIADKLDLSASLDYGYTKTTSAGIYNAPLSEQKNYTGTLALRKYFLYQNKIGFRAGPYLSYNNNDNKTTYNADNSNNDYNSNTKNYVAGFNLDLVYYPSKHVGISATLLNAEYDHFKTNNGSQGQYSGNYEGLSFINNGLTFSVFYVFGS